MAKLFEIMEPSTGSLYTFDAEHIGAVRSLTTVNGIEVYTGSRAIHVHIGYETFCIAWKEALKEPEPFVGVDMAREQRIEFDLEQLRKGLIDPQKASPVRTCVRCGSVEHEPYTCARAAQLRAAQD